MTAEDPWDTNSREKSRRKKDLMMKSCLSVSAPVSFRVRGKDGDAVRCMCICV